MIAQEKIDKILQSPRTPLMRQVELTADERTELRDALIKKGMGASTLYQRINYIGFDTWEMQGINACIAEATSYSGDPTLFWPWMVENGQHTKFTHFMEQLGMSYKVTLRRFSEFDFKPWELEGITAILQKAGQK